MSTSSSGVSGGSASETLASGNEVVASCVRQIVARNSWMRSRSFSTSSISSGERSEVVDSGCVVSIAVEGSSARPVYGVPTGCGNNDGADVLPVSASVAKSHRRQHAPCDVNTQGHTPIGVLNKHSSHSMNQCEVTVWQPLGQEQRGGGGSRPVAPWESCWSRS